MTMKVVLFGKCARTHVIGDILCKNEDVKIYSYADLINPGLQEVSVETKRGLLNDFESITAFVDKCKPDLAITGPDDGIALGLPDLLNDLGIPAVGPNKSLGRLETSKSFTRELLAKHCPEFNPKFKTFLSDEGLREYLLQLENYVVKPDGLTAGKGVKVLGDHLHNLEDSLAYSKQLLEKDGRVVIEEKMIGEEFSLQSFVDGKNVVDSVVAQDNKRAFEGDKGPNTGGMGSYGCEDHLLPFVTRGDIDLAHDINQTVCTALRKESNDEYKGIMYGCYMKTSGGLKVIEYNARFADPEVMNVLPILKSDLLNIFLKMVDGGLSEKDVEFEKKATVCKYVVPEGYPSVTAPKQKVNIHECKNGAKTYFAAVTRENSNYYFWKSRGVAYVGIGDDLYEAERIAEEATQCVEGPVFHRRDIGTRGYIQNKIERMNGILHGAQSGKLHDSQESKETNITSEV